MRSTRTRSLSITAIGSKTRISQVFTYAAALDAPAVLVHPRVDQDVDVEFGAGPHRTRILSVPLHRGIRETCWISSLQVAAEQFTGPLVAGADGG